MNAQPVDISSDPDLIHLFDLLRLLPGPVENPEFWAAVRGVGQRLEPTEENLRYVFEKMARIKLLLDEPTPFRVVSLCEYLLFFFGVDNPDLRKVLRTAPSRLNLDYEYDTGGWWADDIKHTAWKLWVRYHDFGDEEWKAKWQYDRAWTEWLPKEQD